MAGTEPAAPTAARLNWILAHRDATEMGVNPDDDQPFWALHAIPIAFRIDQVGTVVVRLDGLNDCFGPSDNKYGFAAPFDGYALTGFDG